MVCTAPRRGANNRVTATATFDQAHQSGFFVSLKHHAAFPMSDMEPFFHPGRALLDAYSVRDFAYPRPLSQLALIAPMAWQSEPFP